MIRIVASLPQLAPSRLEFGPNSRFGSEIGMADELRFDDRVVIVTGAGRGIGRSHARAFARRGARVVVADHGVAIDGSGSSSAPADGVVDEIRSFGGEAVACCASVADEGGAASIVDTAVRAFGRLDVVVNNAGIHDPAPFEHLTADQFRRMLDVHLLGTVLVTRAAWPHLVESGSGRVVNTVSEAMLGGIPQLSSYGAAKGAVFGLTRNLATEGAARGVHVNAVAPRADTRMSDSDADRLAVHFGFDSEGMAAIKASMPPDLCSPAAVYLGHASCRLNGEVLQVGMGGVARLAVVHTRGISEQPLTAETIAENLAAILDVTGAHVTDASGMQA
jgi:NAD(P)-dependent dehydrogenase (short-subunit alcohol dehydrogenase family)